jgi:putative transposase
MPPAFRNNLVPTAGDTPAWTAASSLAIPAAIPAQNRRRSSRPATTGRPGENNGARPDRTERRLRLVIATPSFKVLRRPFESSQYTSIEFGRRCREADVRPSMGSVGDAYDNAMCESFFATLECELLARCRFQTQAEARSAVFAFIEGFYNPRRRHSSIGYLSPIDYEHRCQERSAIPTHTSLPPCSRPSRTSPSGGPEEGPSLTAAARDGRDRSRAGTEEWLRRGPN